MVKWPSNRDLISFGWISRQPISNNFDATLQLMTFLAQNLFFFFFIWFESGRVEFGWMSKVECSTCFHGHFGQNLCKYEIWWVFLSLKHSVSLFPERSLILFSLLFSIARFSTAQIPCSYPMVFGLYFLFFNHLNALVKMSFGIHWIG